MLTLFSILDYKYYIIGGLVGFIILAIVLASIVNKSKYMARYKRFYRKLEKVINKKYNGNLLNENIINNYAKDQTNTFKSLRRKGKNKVKKYFAYYVKSLPELAMLKSFTTPDRNKNQLAILLLDDFDKLLYRWSAKNKVKGLIKACNKYQMLTAYIGFLFELPLNIHQGAEFRFTNHDNDYVLTYRIVKNIKKIRGKQKPKKLSRKQIKAQKKVEERKAKLERKHQRKR